MATSTPSSPWTPMLPKHLVLPETSLYYNLEVSAARYPTRPACFYYGGTLDYAELRRQVDALAGWLQQRCGVTPGDRVALYLQNSPQFVIAYYAILRADAVVVPINPMNLTREVAHILTDSGATVMITTQDQLARVEPL